MPVPRGQRRAKSATKASQPQTVQPAEVDDPIILTRASAKQDVVDKEATKLSDQRGPDGPLAAEVGRAPFTPGPGTGTGAKEQLFLSGLMPFEEFLQVTAAQPNPPIPWEAQWHQAAAVRQRLAVAEAGIADNRQTQSLPPDFAALLTPVLADPIFQQTVANTEHEFRLVEVDNLVVYQKFINMGHVDRHSDELAPGCDSQVLADFCFPLGQQVALPSVYPAGNSLYVISDSSDIRPLPPGPQLVSLDPAQIGCLMKQPPPRTVCAAVGLLMLFGHSLNFFHVLSVDGRLVLNNAYHRTYTLRRRGHTHVPCLIQTVNKEQFPALAPGTPLAQNPDLYLKASRPPLFKDFFDPTLHVKLANRPSRSMFRVTARVEVEGRILID